MMLLFALALFAPDPTPEALALGKRLAETGTLAGLLPLVMAKDTEELIKAYPELSAEEQKLLRDTAAEVGKAGTDKLMTAIGRGYAEKLSVADLRVLVTFNESDAARRARAATPGVVMGAIAGMGGMDFKKDARLAFCARTGKACQER